MNSDSIKILAVDDSQDILFALSAICELEGWRAVTTTDGGEAVNLLREEKPDIVLVDYHMPRIDGIEVVRNIRAINRAVPIVVLTIESSRSVANSFIEAGADDFALKPIKPVDLISRIRVHLRASSRIENASAAAKAPCAVDTAAASNNDDESGAPLNDEYVKGISPLTLSIVRKYLKNVGQPLTINDISAGCGLAYQTTYRYLTHLVGEGSVIVNSEYGRQGRPKQKYKWKS